MTRAPRIALCVLGLSCSLCNSVRAEDSSSPETEAARLFSVWCLEQDLDLDAIHQKATEARYEVAVDRRVPMGNGLEFTQRNWLVPSAHGSTLLLATNDVTNGAERVLGCSIYGTKLRGAMMEAELSKLPRMGTPTKHPPPGPKGTTVWWSARVGTHAASEDSEVMMTRDAPRIPGVSMNLIYKIHTETEGRGK